MDRRGEPVHRVHWVLRALTERRVQGALTERKALRVQPDLTVHRVPQVPLARTAQSLVPKVRPARKVGPARKVQPAQLARLGLLVPMVLMV